MDYLTIATKVMEDAGVRAFRQLGKPNNIVDLYQDRALGPRSEVGQKFIIAKLPTGPLTLATVAHEAGHIATSPPGMPSEGVERIVDEFKATEWGVNAIRRNGGEVTAAMQDDLRHALGTYIEAYGVVPTTPPELRHFVAGGSL